MYSISTAFGSCLCGLATEPYSGRDPVNSTICLTTSLPLSPTHLTTVTSDTVKVEVWDVVDKGQ